MNGADLRKPIEPDPAISNEEKLRINLLSGASVSLSFDMLIAVAEKEKAAINQIYDVFICLYANKNSAQALNILAIFYDLLGLEFPVEVEQLRTDYSQADYFIFSFLLDMSELYGGYLSESG